MPDRQLLDVEALLRLPRRSGLTLAPDGSRLIVGIAELDQAGKKYGSSLWQVDPTGAQPSRRLTFSDQGEGDATFLPDGSLLFVSARRMPGDEGGEESPAGIWHLPVAGEARRLTQPPGGVAGPSAGTPARTLAVARQRNRVAYLVNAFAGTDAEATDSAKQEARDRSGTSAILYETYPIRYWDHWLGPRQRHLVVADIDPVSGALEQVHRLSPEPGNPLAFEEVSFDLTPDGETLVTGWRQATDFATRRTELVAIDIRSGTRTVLATSETDDFEDIHCAPDGRTVSCMRWGHGDPGTPPAITMCKVDLGTGGLTELATDGELQAGEHAWAGDGTAIYFAAEEQGRVPLFRLDVGSGEVTRISADGHFSDICPPAGDGPMFAIRSRIESPPEIVAVAPGGNDVKATPLRAAEAAVSYARIEEGTATADDGGQVHYWLVLPEGGAPAPLAVFVHGGPLSSWNGWQWRWNASILAASGYAVVMPDPALSTGYGRDFVKRGWGAWGPRPFADIMSAVDAVCARSDVDADRTLLMGGSYGGYMANWTAGHTDRFKAIVTHASLWHLDQFQATTDDALWMYREFGDPWVDDSLYREHSPEASIQAIKTPMLVIHGDRDYRVPVTEGIRLWVDLKRRGIDAKFLFFPDENHWILKPGNVRVWYQTVLAFLDHHVKGEPWRRPELL